MNARVDEAVRLFRADVETLARRLTRDRVEAQELAAATWAELPGALGRYRGEAPLRAFVLAVCRKLAQERHRAELRRANATRALEREAAEEEVAESPEEPLARMELSAALNAALEQLPEAQREALLLTAVEGQSAGEVAELQGVPEETVRSRVFHARKKLRAVLGEGARMWLVVALLLALAAAAAGYLAVRRAERRKAKPQPHSQRVSPPPPTPVVVQEAAPEAAPAPVPRAKPIANTTREAPREEARREAPESELSLFERAETLSREKRSAEAVAAYEAYLAQYPRGTFEREARYSRAFSLLRAGRLREAREALAPFARGDYAGYRQREAAALLESMVP